MKHQERLSAERIAVETAKAVREWNATDESEFLELDRKYRAAVRLLVDMEMKWPTQRETFRKRRFQQMASRGLDVY